MLKLKIEKNVPIPTKINMELTQAIIALNEGESVYLKYDVFNRTAVANSLANARQRIVSKGLRLRTVGDKDGKRIWAVKE